MCQYGAAVQMPATMRFLLRGVPRGLREPQGTTHRGRREQLRRNPGRIIISSNSRLNNQMRMPLVRLLVLRRVKSAINN